MHPMSRGSRITLMAHSTIALLVTLSISVALSELLIKDNVWHSWKEFHSKKYASDDEESLRYTIWNENMKTITKHNADPNSKFTLQMNHLGDMDEKCKYNASSVGVDDTGFVDVKHGNEDALKSAVATVGPVSVAIDAAHTSFKHYKDGVYDEPDCSSVNLDHAVLVVGYGTTADEKDYWLVKNSWGNGWGMDGYIMMSRNKDNQCGIATNASYPLV
ncbi:Cathepsin L [Stylophora pistillata]|uniref:Cathepsin L n=1 Tax=Stylophora pistillata TaxID=50429 RepID=A0A2B4RDU6_STYPI|nr:Cathepsin L [Stylophora pistillata]